MTPERLRNTAYYCFLGLGAGVILMLGIHMIGRASWTPRPVAAGLLILLVMPVTGAMVTGALAGAVLSVLVRTDLRLFALTLLTAGLFVFSIRQEVLGVSPAWSLLYPVGVVLFSIRWIMERRGGKNA